MSVVIVGKKLTARDLRKARQEYANYIKITVDLEQKIVAIGGEYHSDAEKILFERYQSKHRHIWGGGYSIEKKTIEATVLINLKPNADNNSMYILDEKVRNKFLDLVKKNLSHIKSLL